MHYKQDAYASYRTRHDGAYDYSQSFMQPAVAPGPPSYSYQNSSYPSTASLPPISSYHEPVGAPILPPLRIYDQIPFGDDYQRRLQQEQQSAAAREQQRQAAKGEKATGGVSAELDYEMERMTDFVTEATMTMYALHSNPYLCVADVDVTRSFHHKMQSQPSFRKWVSQVLSATRLPSSTIMLSLHYLNDRLARFPDTVSTTNENQIYRLLAVSLILGSKFLDDNTFINRSWSDVTAIKVAELNQLEAAWLQMINYRLHVAQDAPDGLLAWLNAWEEYKNKQPPKQHSAVQLSPLDTNVHRHSPHRERYSPYPAAYGATNNNNRSYDSSRHSKGNSSSYDAWNTNEHSGFDDYYKRQSRYPGAHDFESYSRAAADERARQSTYAYPQTAHPSYYQPSTYASAWDQSAWNAAHRYDCACPTCIYQKHYRPYGFSSNYSAQTVMG